MSDMTEPPLYSHHLPPPEPCPMDNLLRPNEEVPVFFHDTDTNVRESLKEIAYSAICEQRNNTDAIEENINKSDGKGKCAKDGFQFIMDYMKFSEEDEQEERVSSENKMKNYKHHRNKVVHLESDDYSSDSSQERNANAIMKEGGKTHVASNKISNIAAEKSQSMTLTKTDGIVTKNEDTDSLQSVNRNKKQKKSDEVSFVTSNKLHDVTDKNIQFMNVPKFVDMSQSKNYFASAKKLTIRNEPDIKKNTKLPYARVEEGQFMNRTKGVDKSDPINIHSSFLREQNVTNVTNPDRVNMAQTKLSYLVNNKEQFINASKSVGIPENRDCNSASLRTQKFVKIKNVVFKKLDMRNITTQYQSKINKCDNNKDQFTNTSKNVGIPENRDSASLRTPNSITIKNVVFKKVDMRKITALYQTKIDNTPCVKYKTHPIKGTLFKIISKDGVSTSESIQMPVRMCFNKNINLDVNRLNLPKNRNKVIAILPSCLKKPVQVSSNASFDYRKTNLVTKNLIPMKNEDKTKCRLSSSEKFSKASKNLSFDQKEANRAANLNSTEKENLSTVMSSSPKKFPEPSCSLPSDCKQTEFDSTRNENEIAVVPSLSGNVSKDFYEEAHKCEAISSDVAEKNCQTIQLPLKKLRYPCFRQQDLECLPEKNLINDTIIEFYLKYLFNEKLTPELQEKTYICNPFFYPKVLKQLNDTDRNKAKFVETWLKGIDLFSKDFILIPVNVEFNATVKHWYLVIICFLSKIRKMPLYGANSGATVPNAGTQSMFQQNSNESEVTGKRTCICFFDSAYAEENLGGMKLRVAKHLKNFLKTLWLSNHKYETCDWSQLIPLNVICPQQDNWFDCGIFLLQFAESFFQTPINNFEDRLNVTDWFDQNMITEKRKEIKKIIEERMTKI